MNFFTKFGKIMSFFTSTIPVTNNYYFLVSIEKPITNRTSRNTTKVFNRACKADPKEKLFLKNFQRFKKNKTPDTQARQKSTRQMTQTDDIKMVVIHDIQERQPITAVWRNGG